MRADGSGKPEQLVAGGAIVEPYSWSPDVEVPRILAQRAAGNCSPAAQFASADNDVALALRLPVGALA